MVTYRRHGVDDLRDQDLKGLNCFLLVELITAILGKPSGGFFCRQAPDGIGLEFMDDLV